MEVKDEIKFPDFPGYSIEWGNATWTEEEIEDNKDWSIRNRYSRQDGGFNVRGSSEVPWEDFKKMILQSIDRNHFSSKELFLILRKCLWAIIKNIFAKKSLF